MAVKSPWGVCRLGAGLRSSRRRLRDSHAPGGLQDCHSTDPCDPDSDQHIQLARCIGHGLCTVSRLRNYSQHLQSCDNASDARTRVMRRLRASLFAVTLIVIYAIVLLPILVVLGAAVNAGEYLTFPPQGFSTRWFNQF